MYLYGLSHLTSVRLTPVVIGLLVLIFTGLGWLFGKYRLKANTKQIVVRDNLIAAVFGLSALVLGFTFANATVSFNLRMSENFNAATALEEVFVSTKYLEPSDQLQMKKSLRELVDYRLVAHTAKSISTVGFSTIMEKTALLTRKMNEDFITAKQNVTPANRAFVDQLFTAQVAALSAVMHSSAARLKSHLPQVVMQLLIILLAIGGILTGYSMAIKNETDWLLSIFYVTVVSFTFNVILLLEFPSIFMSYDDFNQDLIRLKGIIQ